MPNTAIITPVPKKASDTVSDYITYFSRVSIANSWDDSTQAKIFPSLLEVGNKSLDGLSDTTLSSFISIKKALVGETEPFRESNFANLWNISRKPNETLTSFKERIAGLIERVYPKFAAANKQTLIRDIFIHSLPDNYKKFILSTNNAKTEEALNSALLFESMTPNRNHVGSKFAHRHGQNERGEGRESADSKARQTARPAKSTDLCHFCNQPGHYARDCVDKKKSKDSKFNSSSMKKTVDSITPKKNYATLQIGNFIEEVLVDSGATVSVLPEARYKPTTHSTGKLTVANESTMVSTGTITFPLKTLEGEKLGSHEFIVAPVKKAYIGSDILDKLDAIMDFKRKIVTTNLGTEFKLHARQSLESESTNYDIISDIEFIDDVHFLTNDIPDVNIKNNDESHVNCEYAAEIENLLENYDEMFHGIGKTDRVVHFIPTNDNVPVNLPSYRIPIHLKDKATEIIDEYLTNDIIRPSKSEYNSPILLVTKPSCDKVRVTIDYRMLNSKCKKDAFATPRIDDIVDKLHGRKFFSKIDVKSAFHNIPIAEEDKHKTAFRFEGKLYEWNRTPFGLTNAYIQ